MEKDLFIEDKDLHGDVVAEDAEGQEDEAELAPANRVVHCSNETSEPVVLICFIVRRVCSGQCGIAKPSSPDL